MCGVYFEKFCGCEFYMIISYRRDSYFGIDCSFYGEKKKVIKKLKSIVYFRLECVEYILF